MAIGRKNAGADTSRYRQHMACQFDRLADDLEQVIRNACNLFVILDVLEKHHEFIATEPRDGIAFAHRSLQAAGDATQQRIAFPQFLLGCTLRQDIANRDGKENAIMQVHQRNRDFDQNFPAILVQGREVQPLSDKRTSP